MQRILVSHPHANDVSQATAAALEQQGLLAAFATGVAGSAAGWSGRALERLSRRVPTLANRVLPALPPPRVLGLAAVELGARAVSRASRHLPGPGLSAYDAMYTAHDGAVAALPWPAGTDGVYAYEDAACWTFARAARRGLARVWDLPLPHYAALERMWRTEAARWPDAVVGGAWVEPEWKKRRKDRELALCTAVSVASSFTRESLRDVGCAQPIHLLPYGFPADRFPLRERAPDGPFTVLSAGTQDLRKGTPDLLEAWRRAGLKDARLVLVGTLRLGKAFLDRYAGLFQHVLPVPKAELAQWYRRADVLAFPTLGDGFGLVMQEAMCCGTPVITTRCGGGPECITSGQDGWILPERDPDAWAELLRQLAARRDHVAAVGRAARARAEGFTWSHAGAAFARTLARA